MQEATSSKEGPGEDPFEGNRYTRRDGNLGLQGGRSTREGRGGKNERRGRIDCRTDKKDAE